MGYNISILISNAPSIVPLISTSVSGSFFMATNLLPFTNYTALCSAFTSAGTGPTVAANTMTLSSYPSDSPGNVLVTVLRSFVKKKFYCIFHGSIISVRRRGFLFRRGSGFFFCFLFVFFLSALRDVGCLPRAAQHQSMCHGRPQ